MKKPDTILRFQLIRNEETVAAWHNDLEIIYVLQGQGHLHLPEEKKEYVVQANDIFAVNSLQTHSIISSGDLLMLALYVPQNLLLSVCGDVSYYPCFAFCSFMDTGKKQQVYDNVRTAFAHAFNTYYKEEFKFEIRLNLKVMQILDILLHNFLVDNSIESLNSSGKVKLRDAVYYVNKNYNESIALEDVAEYTSLTNTYLSRLFSRHMGMTFTEYVTSVRMYHANIMINSGKTLTEIAYEVGFSTAGAMITAYKKCYGLTPKEYREKEREVKAGNHNLMEMESLEAFSILLSYMENRESEITRTIEYRHRDVNVDVTQGLQSIKQSWRQTLNAGYVKELLQVDTRAQMERYQAATHCQYARVKGILDDEMRIYDEDENGSPVYNFVILDEVIGYILSLSLTPYICLNYVPGKLAKGNRTHFDKTGIVSIPRNLNKWGALINAVLEHLEEIYGENNVKEWLFTPYLSPEYMIRNILDSEGYWKTYQRTHQILKDHGLTVVSPILNISSNNSLALFLKTCQELACVPERLSFTSLQTDYDEKYAIISMENFDETYQGHISEEENYIGKYFSNIKAILKKFGLEDMPIHLDEWNNNFWQRDLTNDTCYKSCYIFKNILENNQCFTSMSLLSIYDRYEEFRPYPEIFSGGCGLFTRQGIAKAGFYAFELLSRMGTDKLAQGDGYFISTDKKKVQIYLYNYVHYNKLYRHRYATRLSMTDRYHVFNSKSPELFTIVMRGLKKGLHAVQKWTVNTAEGSAYDEWVKMGAPEMRTYEINQYLSSKGIPRQTYGSIDSQDMETKIDIKVQEHEIVLVEITL